jgi:hypothetical protein
MDLFVDRAGDRYRALVAITHSQGYMFISDVPDVTFQVWSEGPTSSLGPSRPGPGPTGAVRRPWPRHGRSRRGYSVSM